MKIWSGFTLATAVSIGNEDYARIRRDIDGTTEICRMVGGVLKCGGGSGGGGVGGTGGATGGATGGEPTGPTQAPGGDKPIGTTARPTQPPATTGAAGKPTEPAITTPKAPVTTAPDVVKPTEAKPTEAAPTKAPVNQVPTIGQVPIKPGVNTPVDWKTMSVYQKEIYKLVNGATVPGVVQDNLLAAIKAQFYNPS